MSDVEEEWKPNGRPTSTLALSFAASLDNVFELTPEIQTLSKSIARKRQSVSIQKSELEKLQARIRETEERLKESQGSASLAPTPGQNPGRITARRPPGLETVIPAESEEEEEDSSESSESSDSASEDDAPGVNKPLRNSQSTAQTSPSEASDSDTEEEEEEPVPTKSPPPRKESLSYSSPTQAGKRPAVRQVQRKKLPSRGKA